MQQQRWAHEELEMEPMLGWLVAQAANTNIVLQLSENGARIVILFE